MLGAVIKDLAVDLVAHHRDLRVALEPGDEPVEFGARHDAAGRVGRAVDDDQPGARRDLVQHLVGAEREAGRSRSSGIGTGVAPENRITLS